MGKIITEGVRSYDVPWFATRGRIHGAARAHLPRLWVAATGPHRGPDTTKEATPDSAGLAVARIAGTFGGERVGDRARGIALGSAFPRLSARLRQECSAMSPGRRQFAQLARLPATSAALRHRHNSATINAQRATPRAPPHTQARPKNPYGSGKRGGWSGRPGSNRRRPAWEAGILPLNYARSRIESLRRRSPSVNSDGLAEAAARLEVGCAVLVG
jgi:hypothetical protein